MKTSKRRNVKMSKSRCVIAMVALSWLSMTSQMAPGQTTPDPLPGAIHPLASKEEMIRDRFERFMDRVYALQEQLSEAEPDNAVRLERVLQRAGELGLAEQLEQIVQLLRDSPSMTNALDAQDVWVRDADQLLAILLARDGNNEEREQKIERLEAYRQQLKHILEQQQELRDATDQAKDGSSEGERSDSPSQPSEEEWDNTKQADRQREVAAQTNGLSRKMKEDAESDASSPGKGSKSSPPGQQSLQRAQGDMDDAAKSLDDDELNDATEEQDDAISELEQAKRELEDALSQLRQEDRAETLRDLEARFREMLSKQKAVNSATIRLAEVDQDMFRRAEQLQAADLASKERTLSEKAATCEHILDEEGTTIAFPRIVGQLAEDMGSIADRLAAFHVGPITQGIEQEVVETLEQLLGALKKMQQENEQQGGMAGSGGDKPQQLLPPSAELKLLRSSQSRVNTRTQAVETARTTEPEPEAGLVGLLKTTTERQAECAEIAEDIRERQNMP